MENGHFYNIKSKHYLPGNLLAVQWLGLGTLPAGAPGLIPSLGTKIPQAVRPKKTTKKQKP